MSLFACCKQVQNGNGYKVLTTHNNKNPTSTFVKSYDKATKDVDSPNVSVVKLIKSDYDTIVNDYGKKNKKWTDGSFPPNDQSLGVIPNVTSNTWKRISQIVPNPVIFNQPLNPNHITQQQHPDKAFMASAAALAQNPDRIQQIFCDQTYNPNGFYKLQLRTNSEVHEILIDDFIPIDENGSPLFAKPHENDIWVMLVEKARAKIYGSYENMFGSNSNPKNILEQITLAPTQQFLVVQSDQESGKQKVWRSLVQNSTKKRPIVVRTSSKADINWGILNLQPNHFYTMVDFMLKQIDSASLKSSLGKQQRVLKLRNASGVTQWNGTGNENDKIFWDQIQASDEKQRFTFNEEFNKDGIFYILFTDFIKYFTEVFINHYQPYGNFLTDNLFFDFKHGLVHQVQVIHQGFYTFSIDAHMQSFEEGIPKISILLIRKYKQKSGPEYEFVDGYLNTDRQTPLVKSHLTPGTYIIYTKIRPTPLNQNFPKNPQLVIYSEKPVRFELSRQESNPDLLKKTFLNYGRSHKRQQFNDDLMWTSWKLFNQGGYGYFAFGNDKESKEKFVVTLNEEDFKSQGYTLKKPCKGKEGNQIFEVNPGQQAIILLTVGNSVIKNRKFPPKMGVNIHPYIAQE